jgi:hypothetical protein
MALSLALGEIQGPLMAKTEEESFDYSFCSISRSEVSPSFLR